jgi:lipoprotein signal peptidase
MAKSKPQFTFHRNNGFAYSAIDSGLSEMFRSFEGFVMIFVDFGVYAKFF